MAKEAKPTVLVLGGCSEGFARAMLTYLVPTDGSERRASHVRLVDKHLVLPAADAYTVYMDPLSKKALQEPDVEYMQANLLLEDSRRKAFTLPASHGGPSTPYDYIFDFSGEPTYDASAQVYAERTTKLLPLLGRLAAERRVGAYVREVPYIYRQGKGERRALGDAEGQPVGERARWTHEGIRALAAVPGLNLVLARPGLLYGPYTTIGYTPRLLTGVIYKYLSEPMQFLWSPDLKLNTLHAHDLASSFLALAHWASTTPLSARQSLASPIPTSLSSSDRKLLPQGKGEWPGAKEDVKGVWFNVVDEGDTTQGVMAELTGKVVGVEVGYHGAVINQFAKLNMDDVVEDVNEKHLSTWAEMLSLSTPPLADAPISPLVPADLLTKLHVSLDGSRIREVTGWKPTVKRMTAEGVGEMLELFREEGFWPNAPPRKK